MPTSNLDLLTVGDCSIDLYMKVDTGSIELSGHEHPKMCFLHGSKIPVQSFFASPAGNSCHVAVRCKLLGLNTLIYTELGDDDNANKFITEFKTHQIDTTFCVKNPGTPTNVHAVIVAGGDRTIFTYHEKRNYKMLNWPTPKWLHYSTLAPGFEKFQTELVKYINEHPQIGVAFNPGSSQLKDPKAVKEFLAVTDILFVNVEEAEKIAGKAPIKELHTKLQTLGPKLTVITDGEKGSTTYDGKTFMHMEAYKTNEPVVDKTGVGDAYSSGFLSAIFYGKSVSEAMKWGSINAQGVLTKIGGVNGLRSRQEIEELAKNAKLKTT